MTQEDKEWNIYEIEEYYCNRMQYLVDEERFNDSHAIFEEFVVGGQEPEEYLFVRFQEEV